MHGLIKAKSFHVGPVQRLEKAFLPRHLGRPDQRLERHIFRRSERLDAIQKGRQRKADPRDDHRPALDAAHAIDALFERDGLENVFKGVGCGFRHEAIDLHRPGARFQRTRIGGRIALPRSELIEVVVARDIRFRRERLIGRERALGKCERGGVREGRAKEERCDGPADELAPPQIHLARRYL